MATPSSAPARLLPRPRGGASFAAVLLLAACGGSGRGTREPGGEDAALEAYRKGDFDRAEALARGGTSLESRILQARLHLLRNRPREAIEALYPLAAPYQPFTAKVPSKYDELQVLTEVLSELSQAYVRSDDFSTAGRVSKALGDNILATKYEALAKLVAYLPSEGWTEVTVPLDAVDPVPHFTMDVNGRPGVFLIDTSIDQIVIEREFAKRAGLKAFGVATRQYNVSYD
ncbi:MAG TPA: hypothetical protein VEN81_13010, partial [Planctomycetota bacterium]|nr:hypothetical protein [Planctomycetota bacterium]